MCTRTTARVIALLEVLVVFAIVHIAWRSFKHFTALGSMERSAGLNFSPGAVMIAATLVLVALRQEQSANYGLTLKRWPEAINIGVLAALLLIAGAGLLALLDIRPNHPLIPPDVAEGIIGALGAFIATVLLASLLKPGAKASRLPWLIAATVGSVPL